MIAARVLTVEDFWLLPKALKDEVVAWCDAAGARLTTRIELVGEGRARMLSWWGRPPQAEVFHECPDCDRAELVFQRAFYTDVPPPEGLLRWMLDP